MRRKVIFISIVAALSCFLQGCNRYSDQEQRDWNSKIRHGVGKVHRLTRPGLPLLVDEQLILLMGYEPDLKIGTLKFPEIFAKDDPYKNRAMSDIWEGYCLAKQQLGEFPCDESPDKWQDCKEFKKCTLWIYDESKHFKKALYSDGWLYCLFCAKEGFLSALFFVENHHVIKAIVIDHEKPLQNLPN